MSGVEEPLPPIPGGGGGDVPTGPANNNNNPVNNNNDGGHIPGINLQGNAPNVRVTFRAGINPTNNNNGEVPPPPQQTQNLFHMRDRLFLAIFIRVTLLYARACPKRLRRILEFCLLIQSLVLLGVLAYIHIVYTRTPITCLADYKNSWPRDGILRVEITTESPEEYDIMKSYEKEERIRQRAASSQLGHYSDDFLTTLFAADTLLLDRFLTTVGDYLKITSKTVGAADEANSNSPASTVEFTEKSTSEAIDENDRHSSTALDPDKTDDESLSLNVKDGLITASKLSNKSDDDKQETVEDDLGLGLAATGAVGGEDIEDKITSDETIAPSFLHTASGSGSSGVNENDSVNPESQYFNKTLEEIEIMKMKQKELEEETILKSTVSDYDRFSNSVWMQDLPYIVEYSLEVGFLRISPETRQRLNIPVKIVTLDPNKEACFGDPFSRFLLEKLLGYDDILMSSIKNLAEQEDNKGFLRNVVTGEQFRFVAMHMSRTSYIPAFVIMLVFTVSVSMLLRYSHHQVFVFIVDLLNNIEGAGSIHIPAAPLFTVILALVGMEAIMSEFFNDRTIAFYVIFIVWICDQYDSVCSHTSITKTHWVRFFYLYHFAYYAYHYRFNGQHGYLALLVSWSFIQHSMVYFYHHYELPAILRQVGQATHQNVQIPGEVEIVTGVAAGQQQQQQVPQQQQQATNSNSASQSSTPASASNVQRVSPANNSSSTANGQQQEGQQGLSSVDNQAAVSTSGDSFSSNNSTSAITNDNTSSSIVGSSSTVVNDPSQTTTSPSSSSSSSVSSSSVSKTTKNSIKVSEHSSPMDESQVQEQAEGPQSKNNDNDTESKKSVGSSGSDGGAVVGDEGSDYVMMPSPSVDMTMGRQEHQQASSTATSISAATLGQNNNPQHQHQQTNSNNNSNSSSVNNNGSSVTQVPNIPPHSASSRLYPVDNLVNSLEQSFMLHPRHALPADSLSVTSDAGAISFGSVEFRRLDFSDIDDGAVGVMDNDVDDEHRGEAGGEQGN